MRIAVTTPQGNVGAHLTRMLVRAGVRPLLLTRHPDTIPDALREHVDVATADSRQADEVVAATRGVDGLYWVDPTTEAEDPLAEYARATEAVVAAVRANGIRRVVFQSSVGAERRQGAGEIDGLAATEVALDQLAADDPELALAHLRCGYFFANLMLQADAITAGTIQTVLPLDAPMAWVAPRDIAEVAAGLLLGPEWRGRRVQAVHGPEDLTWAEVGELLSTELGREVRVERIPDDAMLAQLREAGMSDAMAESVLGMSTGLRDDFVPEQPRTLVSTTPSTLRGWVHEELLDAL